MKGERVLEVLRKKDSLIDAVSANRHFQDLRAGCAALKDDVVEMRTLRFVGSPPSDIKYCPNERELQ